MECKMCGDTKKIWTTISCANTPYSMEEIMNPEKALWRHMGGWKGCPVCLAKIQLNTNPSILVSKEEFEDFKIPTNQQ